MEQPAYQPQPTFIPYHYLTITSFVRYETIVIVVAKSLNLLLFRGVVEFETCRHNELFLDGHIVTCMY